MHFGQKWRILGFLVGYSPCILVKNDAFLVILVGYSPCILHKK